MNNETTTAITPPAKCGYCGMIHGDKCPLVKALEYHPDGTVKRVEFFAPNDYVAKLGGGLDWPSVLPPGQWGPAIAYSGGEGAFKWTDASGWQRLDGGSSNIPRN